MMLTTIKHKEIKEWASKFKGKPAIIDSPDSRADKQGIRIDFPGEIDDLLLADNTVESTWTKFFEIFDRNQLAFMYEPKPKVQDLSLAYRFIKRSELENKEELPQI